MATFVLEVGFEEMPASFLNRMEEEAKSLFVNLLKVNKIKFKEISTSSTPRRLVVLIEGIGEIQDKTTEIKVGPPARVAYDEEGKLTKAGLGFLRSQGAEEKDGFIHKTDKGEYLAIKKNVGGNPTISLLPSICFEVMTKISFPKRMRWEETKTYFGRPIRWIVALFDDKVVKFEFASVKSSNISFGHRVMGEGVIKVPHAREFFSLVKEKGKIIFESRKREEIIKQKGDALAKEVGGNVVWDDDLLKEVANLVEFPNPVLGKFEDKFLSLPREVLLTCMQTHQKCFGIEKGGKLLPYFLCTLNLIPKDLELVRKGWERVLKARLEDASFFWNVDMKASFNEWFDELGKVIFIASLGSLKDKCIRLERLSGYLADEIGCSLKDDICRAARLCKADLVSEMVGEFADLQGIMGGIYAMKKGEKENVSLAIYDHYLPTGPESPLPRNLEGAILSIVDKADNIGGCFGLDMIPTGNQDPYALRRHALGIIRITLGYKLRFSLKGLFNKLYSLYGEVDWKIEPSKSVDMIMEFFSQRLKTYFTSLGFSTKIVDAAIGAGFDDIFSLNLRLKALDEFSKKSDFEQAILTFKRVDNIIRKQGEKEAKLTGNFKEELLEEPQEKKLANTIKEIRPRWDELWSQEKFYDLFLLLYELKPVVDEFFDHVLVMCEDKDLRINRLNILKSLVNKLSMLADFSALQI